MIVGGASASGGYGAAATRDSLETGFGGTEFMQLLLAQLRHQNPLDPVQDKEFMGQLTQVNSLMELQKMNRTLQSSAQAGQLTQAAGLIGRSVQFAGDDGLQSGVVTAVGLEDGQVMLALGTFVVPLANVISVSPAVAGA